MQPTGSKRSRYVYVLNSPSSAELRKIGIATNISSRVRSLNKEPNKYGVYYPYLVEFALCHPKAEDIESLSHHVLTKEGRHFCLEMFECQKSKAIEVVLASAGFISAGRKAGYYGRNIESDAHRLVERARDFISRGEQYIVPLIDKRVSKYNDWAKSEIDRLRSKSWTQRLYHWSFSKAKIYSTKAHFDEQARIWNEGDQVLEFWLEQEVWEIDGSNRSKRGLISLAQKKGFSEEAIKQTAQRVFSS